MTDIIKQARIFFSYVASQRNNGAATLLFVFFLFALFFNLSYISDQSFVDLARSFLAGRLDLVSGSTYDTAFWNGKYYWPFGPLPSILLMPGVFLWSLFGATFTQGYLQYMLGGAIAYLCFRGMRHLGYTMDDAWYGVLAFCCASMFLGVFFIPNYSFFAHIVTVFFLFLALNEFFLQKRYGRIGLCLALALATRPTAVFGIFFFIANIIFSRTELRKKFLTLARLLLPIGVIGALLGWYNYVRFGSPLETGYLLQTLTIPELIAGRAQGLLSIIHIPHNVYYALFALPSLVTSGAGWVAPFFHPNPWGMSILVTSPYLFLLFFFRYASRTSRSLLFSVGVTAVALFLYYGIGYWQFGYRYALDFFPFLFILFFREYREKRKNLSKSLKMIIITSSLVNAYLYFSLLFYHP